MSKLTKHVRELRAIARDLEAQERSMGKAQALIREGAELIRNPGDGCAVITMRLNFTTGQVTTKYDTGKGVMPSNLLSWAVNTLNAEQATLVECPIHIASGMEAPSGVETGNTDSTVGDSPTANGGDAQNTPR
jgi:hypothetical protein